MIEHWLAGEVSWGGNLGPFLEIEETSVEIRETAVEIPETWKRRSERDIVMLSMLDGESRPQKASVKERKSTSKDSRPEDVG